MTFPELAARDFEEFLVGEFAETIVYFPKDGDSRTIPALVTRRGNQRDHSGNHHSELASVEIEVRSSATTGISDPKLGDSITLAGAASEKWDFERVLAVHLESVVIVWRRRTIRTVERRVL